MNPKCNLKDFRVAPATKVDLAQWPTKLKPPYTSKERYHKLLDEYREELSDLQRVLYAHDRYAVLLIFQGMDTAGKDGAIRHVMSGVNPQGCQVFSFKQPSSEELDHDFLWRTNQRLPERGRIGILNAPLLVVSHARRGLGYTPRSKVDGGTRLPANRRKSTGSPRRTTPLRPSPGPLRRLRAASCPRGDWPQ